MYIYIYVYVCMYIFKYICKYMHVDIHIYLKCLYTSVYICTYIYVYVYINIYIYIFIFENICMCIYLCTHVYIYIYVYYIYIYIYICIQIFINKDVFTCIIHDAASGTEDIFSWSTSWIYHVYMHVYKYMQIYLYKYVCIYAYTCKYICMSMFVHMYVYSYVLSNWPARRIQGVASGGEVIFHSTRQRHTRPKSPIPPLRRFALLLQRQRFFLVLVWPVFRPPPLTCKKFVLKCNLNGKTQNNSTLPVYKFTGKHIFEKIQIYRRIYIFTKIIQRGREIRCGNGRGRCSLHHKRTGRCCCSLSFGVFLCYTIYIQIQIQIYIQIQIQIQIQIHIQIQMQIYIQIQIQIEIEIQILIEIQYT